MSIFQRLSVIFPIFFTGIAIDQGTKFVAKSYLFQSGSTSYLGDIFRLTYIENHGAFLGLGSVLHDSFRFWIFTVAVGILLLSLVVFLILQTNTKRSFVITMSLILTGGASNLIDRIYNNGGVIDFMNVGVGSLRTGVFNIADMLITAGICLLLFLNRNIQNAKY